MLPPFGKSLREKRDRGEHPYRVFVFFISYWYNSPVFCGDPAINIPRRDYHACCYDFSILAGLPVMLITDEVMHKDMYGAKSFDLALEIAVLAAPVYIIDINYSDIVVEDLADILLARAIEEKLSMLKPCVEKVWPSGWSDEKHKDYLIRSKRILDFYLDSNTGCAA